VPAESPARGFTHLKFEALLTAAQEPANPYDVALLGLLGLWIFEAASADIAACLGECLNTPNATYPRFTCSSKKIPSY
jgi:hypothetical protein